MAIEEQDGAGGKRCTACGTWKPLEEYRTRKPGVGDGFFSQCKACERAIKRVKRAENPARHRERARRWQQAHPEKTAAARRRWREAHRTTEQERAKARRLANIAEYQQKNSRYYAANKERLLLRQEQLRAKYPERNREQVREWRKRFPDKKKAQKRRRRALTFNTPGAHTEAEWRALKASYDHRCLRCGRREPEVLLTRDHVIPLGQPGASDRIDNIQPLCGPCNAWKGRRALDFRAARPAEA